MNSSELNLLNCQSNQVLEIDSKRSVNAVMCLVVKAGSLELSSLLKKLQNAGTKVGRSTARRPSSFFVIFFYGFLFFYPIAIVVDFLFIIPQEDDAIFKPIFFFYNGVVID